MVETTTKQQENQAEVNMPFNMPTKLPSIPCQSSRLSKYLISNLIITQTKHHETIINNVGVTATNNKLATILISANAGDKLLVV